MSANTQYTGKVRAVLCSGRQNAGRTIVYERAPHSTSVLVHMSGEEVCGQEVNMDLVGRPIEVITDELCAVRQIKIGGVQVLNRSFAAG